MLFKDLKNIINEADEANNEPPVDDTQEPENTSIKRKPMSTKKDVQKASDGVGKESYKNSIKIETKLETTLKSLFNVESVKVANNVVTVVFKFSGDVDKFIVPSTGREVTKDEVISQIQLLVLAGLGVSGDDVDMSTNYIGGVLTITVKSKIETTED